MSRSKIRKQSKPAGKESAGKYTVGHKRPPIAAKPGGVGDPKGRPQKQKTAGQSLQESLMRPMRIKKHGRWMTKTAQEHMMDQLAEAAAQGEMRAIQLVFALQHRYKDSSDAAKPARLLG